MSQKLKKITMYWQTTVWLIAGRQELVLNKADLRLSVLMLQFEGCQLDFEIINYKCSSSGSEIKEGMGATGVWFSSYQKIHNLVSNIIFLWYC